MNITPISKAMSKLILNQPWFGSLALRLRQVEDPSIPTLCTDGIEIRYNPTYFNSLNDAQASSALCHEVLHNAFCHFSRRGSRDPFLWNAAGDFVINLELKKCGFEIAREWLLDKKYEGMTTEQVYTILEKNAFKFKGPKCCSDAPGTGEKEGSGKNPTCGLGGPSESGKTPGQLEQEWQVAVAQASAVSEKHGKMPASMRRAPQSLEPQSDWRHVVHRYLTKLGDVSWSRPNRRFIAENLYLPGAMIDSLGTLVIAVDTSGSIGERMLSLFAAEANGILGVAGWPERVLVIYCDAAINGVEEAQGQITLTPHGGGGTAFQPVFDYLSNEGIQPDVLFYLTDLMGDEPQDPGYPVVWVAPFESTLEGKFGETIKVPLQ